ncbi:MAG: tetratricopeptide repeat protein [Thermoplasmata archaeon]
MEQEMSGLDAENTPDAISKKPQKKPSIVGQDKDKFKIERIMLVYNDGRHVQSKVITEVADFDGDIFGGMLSAVQTFVRDSFKAAGGKLNTIHYGNMKILIEKGVQVYVALVAVGNEPEGTRELMRRFLIDLREKNPWLAKKSWDGDAENFKGLTTLLDRLYDQIMAKAKLEEDARAQSKPAGIKELEPPKKLTEEEITLRCAIAAELLKHFKKEAMKLKKAGLDTTDLERNIKFANTYINSRNVVKCENFTKTAETLLKELLNEAAAKGIQLAEDDPEFEVVDEKSQAQVQQPQQGVQQIQPVVQPQVIAPSVQSQQSSGQPLTQPINQPQVQPLQPTIAMQQNVNVSVVQPVFVTPPANIAPPKINVPPNTDPKVLLREGTQALRLQKFDLAIQKFDTLLAMDGNDAVAWFNKGIAFFYKNKFNEAVACYDMALSINPYDADIWSNKGLVLRKMGMVEEAIKCYDKALQINPNDASVWNNKAIALKAIGKIEEAINCYDSALAYNPRDPSLWNNKGIALKSIGKTKEAIACYNKALEIDPKYEKAKRNKEIAEMSLQ